MSVANAVSDKCDAWTRRDAPVADAHDFLPTSDGDKPTILRLLAGLRPACSAQVVLPYGHIQGHSNEITVKNNTGSRRIATNMTPPRSGSFEANSGRELELPITRQGILNGSIDILALYASLYIAAHASLQSSCIVGVIHEGGQTYFKVTPCYSTSRHPTLCNLHQVLIPRYEAPLI